MDLYFDLLKKENCIKNSVISKIIDSFYIYRNGRRSKIIYNLIEKINKKNEKYFLKNKFFKFYDNCMRIKVYNNSKNQSMSSNENLSINEGNITISNDNLLFIDKSDLNNYSDINDSEENLEKLYSHSIHNNLEISDSFTKHYLITSFLRQIRKFLFFLISN